MCQRQQGAGVALFARHVDEGVGARLDGAVDDGLLVGLGRGVDPPLRKREGRLLQRLAQEREVAGQAQIGQAGHAGSFQSHRGGSRPGSLAG